jgi:hypothetical protein
VIFRREGLLFRFFRLEGDNNSFHDAKLRELELRQGVAPSRLVAHTFRMESEIDTQGYFAVLDLGLI